MEVKDDVKMARSAHVWICNAILTSSSPSKKWFMHAIFLFTRMRLRKKTWKSPGRIYRNDQILDDVVIYSGTFDLFVEELQGRLTSFVFIAVTHFTVVGKIV